MRELLTSPFRRAGTRIRGRVYAEAIDLAGRGLFWPVVAALAAVAAVVAALLWQPVTALLYEHSVVIFLVLMAGSGIWAKVTDTTLGWLLWSWCLLYLVVGVPTLIWAAYPGLGGGAQELAFWIVLFALGMLAALTPFRKRLDGIDVVASASVAMMVGWGLGLIGFTVYHVAVIHPRPGDWWVAPACSAVCTLLTIAVALVSARMRRHP